MTESQRKWEHYSSGNLRNDSSRRRTGSTNCIARTIFSIVSNQNGENRTNLNYSKSYNIIEKSLHGAKIQCYNWLFQLRWLILNDTFRWYLLTYFSPPRCEVSHFATGVCRRWILFRCSIGGKRLWKFRWPLHWHWMLCCRNVMCPANRTLGKSCINPTKWSNSQSHDECLSSVMPL